MQWFSMCGMQGMSLTCWTDSPARAVRSGCSSHAGQVQQLTMWQCTTQCRGQLVRMGQ